MSTPFFSIIIPTRNRANLFARALESVTSQITEDKFEYEIVVINDGSSSEQLPLYKQIISTCSESIKSLDLRFRELGHGPSYSRNEGVNLADGKYICFLDDDDEWIDTRHLISLFEYIGLNQSPVDSIYLFQQIAQLSDGKILSEELWNRDLIKKLNINNHQTITKRDIGNSNGFTHLNCLICAKKLFVKSGGFDESLRYEEDRNLFFRIVDIAEQINLFKKDIAKHYVPNKKMSQNISTSILETEKLIMQVNSDIKLLTKVNDKHLKRSIKTHLLNSAKKISEVSNDQEVKLAFSGLALSLNFSIKWFLYVTYLKFKRAF